VAAYYFPNYHLDERNQTWYGEGFTEWDLVKAARPRFPGHRQPLEPAWGYFDEADPAWAALEIDLAADHGLTAFLYDWYWYEDGPYLQDALERGFLGAPNNERLKFALMWANHDWLNLQPARLDRPAQLLMPGGVSPAGFERLAEHVAEHYLTRPNYLTLDGLPYFSIYDLQRFVDGIGGLEAARTALDRFRARARHTGFPDLHLNAIFWGPAPGVVGDLAAALGITSFGTYTWVHHYDLTQDGFPRASYARAAEGYARWCGAAGRLRLPYQPNVTMGFDTTPRIAPSDVPVQPRDYPWLAVLEGNTPDSFRAALEHGRELAGSLPGGEQRLVTLNAWNEWTEGSYLLPEALHGTAYLEAVRDVFGAES
jgi:hypothetical protein